MKGTETFGVKFDASKKSELARTLKKKGKKGYTGDHPAVFREYVEARGETVPIWRQDPQKLADSIVAVVRDVHISQGYTMTLRALYYQLVGANYIPNNQVVYEVLSEFVSEMRLGGAIPWTALEDRGRYHEKPYFEFSVKGSLERTVDAYALDRQGGQPIHLEVMAEKDAVSNVVGPVCRKYGVPFTICRGWNSTSAIHDAYLRMIGAINDGRLVKILYLGDHDPSGWKMREDLKVRLSDKLILGQRVDLLDLCETHDLYQTAESYEFPEYYDHPDSGNEYWYYWDYCLPNTRKRKKPVPKLFQFEGEALAANWIRNGGLEIVDVALTLEQIEERNLPHNPAKTSDSNFDAYVAEFGTDKSWELDAIPYRDLEEILEAAIRERMDLELLGTILAQEEADKTELRKFIKGATY